MLTIKRQVKKSLFVPCFIQKIRTGAKIKNCVFIDCNYNYSKVEFLATKNVESLTELEIE